MTSIADRLAGLSPAQRALLEKRLAGKQPAAAAPPIAIIGMACRFPGAATLDDYWRIIHGAEDATSETPPNRWDVDALFDPTGERPGSVISRRGGYLDNIDQFDPQFFGITPREANHMDPQQRLLLEVAWEALENAGRPADQIAGSATGVFVGIGGYDFSKVPTHLSAEWLKTIDGYMGTGNALSIAANRLSYILDLHGPSMAVDTACSSASVAIHLAVESLRRGECPMALAGGVNAILTPETSVAFSHARMLSPDGRCRPFDAGANGYVRAEGCGLVVLKRLDDAQRDGDDVLAVIRATAVNQDGRTSGISAPNGESQKRCLRAALRGAGLGPENITYIEAHGTGTPLGDPIETQALAEVFKNRGADDPPVNVTSVKANIGHAETASGIAGLIKVVLMMQRGEIPPQAHLETLNPHITLEGSRIRVPREPTPWTGPRVAGVSSFGFGGTNAHLIVAAPDDAPAAKPSGLILDAQVMKLSGKTPVAVAEQARRFADRVERGDAPVEDFCLAANTGRCDFAHRAAVVAADLEKLVAGLRSLADGSPGPTVRIGRRPGFQRRRVALLFSGQGAQFAGMGQGLMRLRPFRQAIERCAAAFEGELELPLLDVLAATQAGGANGQPDAELIHQTQYTQPALFALEYALAQLWAGLGVQADLVAGHSIGEYVAATVAGAMEVEDAARLVATRARLMQSAPTGGKMAAVFAAEDVVARALEGHEAEASIAAINSPENTVVSGVAEAVDAVTARLAEAGHESRELRVSHAFHSPMMDGVLDEFERAAAGVDYQPPRLPIASNLTGALTTEAPTARYWRDHLRSAVRFADNLTALAEAGAATFIEAGPGATLLGLGRRTLPAPEKAEDAPAWLPSLRQGQSDTATFAGSVADHYVHGGTVDWRQWHAGAGGGGPRRVDLPNYPFARTHHWIEGDDQPVRRSRRLPSSAHPLLGARVPAAWANRLYETTLRGDTPGYLADHVVQGSIVTPAAAYLEQALAAAADAFGAGRHAVLDLQIGQAMFLSDAGRPVQITVSPESSGEASLEVYSAKEQADKAADSDAAWGLHAAARLRHGPDNGEDYPGPPVDLDAWRAGAADERDGIAFYKSASRVGFNYGPQFQVLSKVATRAPAEGGAEALAELVLGDATAEQLARYTLHPVVGDACLQTLACTITGDAAQHGHMPVAIERVEVLRRLEAGRPLRVFARRREGDDQQPDTVIGDAWLLAEDGAAIAELQGIRLQAIGGRAGEAADPTRWLYQMAWTESSLPDAAESDATGTWLLLADGGGVLDEVAERLEATGATVMLVRSGDEYQLTVDPSRPRSTVQIDSRDADHFRRLIATATANPSAQLAGVVSAWALDAPAENLAALRSNADPAEAVAAPALLLLQQALRAGAAPKRGVWLVTAGAQVGAGLPTGPVAVNQAALIGFGRVALVECADLRPRLLDLDAAATADEQAAALLEELTAGDDDEDQLAYRGAKRFAVRLTPAPEIASEESASQGKLAIPARGAYRLRITKPGTLEALRYALIHREPPPPGLVEFEVHATALNFSDVLKALGLYPGIRDAIVPLGIEASGVVTAVGEGVDRFAVGDEVMGVAPYAFASHATTPEYTLAPKPKRLTHQQAAAIPIAFMTAYHGLVRLAQLAPGERVLIHAGAGGVGLAAIQIAQRIGAEVFATAGSDEKRDYVRSLGVPHVMSSRTLSFADEVLAATDRQGVDVVLNSLPGEAITKNLSVLRAYGRFLEIGKIDIYQDKKIGLLPFQDNLSYFAIDLDRVLRQRPDYVRALLAEVLEPFNEGGYRMTQLTEFPAHETIAAFRYMQQRKNIGKIVVSKAEEDDTSGARAGSSASPAEEAIREDRAYLITGGLGALGLRLADWLADQGAGAVVLVSRGAPRGAAAEKVDALRQRGVRVECLQADVADADGLQRAMASLPADLPPLRGVIHAAGVLADGLLTDMSLEQLAKPMRPKTVGAWNLHHATADQPLGFFVLFSSVASVLGSPGQSNYAAGNAVLDALAHARRQAGLPATVVNWGPWAGGGMAAEGGQAEAIESRGMGLLPPDACLDVLGRLIRSGEPQAVVADVRWGAMARSLGARRPAALADLLGAEDAEAGTAVSQADLALRNRLRDAAPQQRRTQLVELVQGELARVTAVEPEGLDAEQPLADFGLDSLMSLELKNSVEARLGVTLPMATLLDGPTIRSLAEALDEQFGAEGEERRTDDEAWHPVSRLSAGQQPALFLMPTLGVDVQCYRDLVAALKGDRAVLAIRPRGLNDAAPPHDTIDEMVTDYAAAILAEQPEGPYYLAAWSTGGVPAVAVAERLESQGAEVGLVALFDTPHPRVYKGVNVNDDLAFLVEMMRFAAKFSGHDIEMTVDQFAALPPEQRFGRALDEAKRAGMMPQEVEEAFVRRLVAVGEGLIRATAEYEPAALRAPVCLFRPTEEGALEAITHAAESDDHGWADHFGDRLELRRATGDHYSLMTGEGARQLAAQIEERIARSAD